MNDSARSRTNELTLLAVIATVVMLFAAFSSAYLIRRTGADFLRIELPDIVWVNTAILVVCSATLEMARRRGRAWMAATIGLGFVFLAGQIAVWKVLAGRGVFLPSNPHAAFLYMLSAVHGLHVIGGLAALVYAMRRRHLFGLCALFWHFVGGLWIYVLVLLRVL